MENNKIDESEPSVGCVYRSSMWNFIQYTVRRFGAHIAIKEELSDGETDGFCGRNGIFDNGQKCRVLCDKGKAALKSGGGAKYSRNVKN